MCLVIQSGYNYRVEQEFRGKLLLVVREGEEKEEGRGGRNDGKGGEEGARRESFGRTSVRWRAPRFHAAATPWALVASTSPSFSPGTTA